MKIFIVIALLFQLSLCDEEKTVTVEVGTGGETVVEKKWETQDGLPAVRYIKQQPPRPGDPVGIKIRNPLSRMVEYYWVIVFIMFACCFPNHTHTHTHTKINKKKCWQNNFENSGAAEILCIQAK